MRLTCIDNMESANTWLPGYIDAYNRRFAVAPKDASDAHLACSETPERLRRILSIQVMKTLSKNLSCQYENQLLQVAHSGTGLDLRGAKVMLHEHFDGNRELIWKNRKLTCSAMDKPRRQTPVADGKGIKARIDSAMARRQTAHKPAANHPWRGAPREGATLRVSSLRPLPSDSLLLAASSTTDSKTATRHTVISL